MAATPVPSLSAGSSVLLLLLACGCGRDPILDKADDLAERSGAGGGGGAAAAEPAPGRAAAPAPGTPADPPPGQAVAPAPGQPEPGGLDVPRVPVRGEVRLADYRVGSVKIDAFDGDQKDLDGPRPAVVGVVELDAPGAFTLEVPAGTEEIWIGAHVDEDMDGRPNPQEPSAWYAGNPVSVGEAGAEGIVLELERAPSPPQHGL